MESKFIALFVFAFVLSSNSNAALIDIDWQSANDKHIIRDTDTGLDWLDLSVTAAISHDDVVANLTSGGQFHEFRLANQSEVLTLWQNAGIVNNERVWVTYQFAPVKNSLRA